MFCDVAFNMPVRREFTYNVPIDWHNEVSAGDRVIAPLLGRAAVGIVAVVRKHGDAAGVKSLIRPAAGYGLPKDILSLCRWTADYYLSSLGEALFAAAGPSVSDARLIYRLRRFDWDGQRAKQCRITSSDREILGAMSARRAVNIETIHRAVGGERSTVKHALARLASYDIVVAEWQYTLPPIPRNALISRVRTASMEGERPRLPRISGGEPVLEMSSASTFESLARTFPGGGTALRDLIAAGGVDWHPLGIANPDHPVSIVPEPSVDAFDDDQRSSWAELCHLLDGRAPATALLWGPTGSGKTAVYCEAIRHTWSLGRTALFLVPEIGLASQMIRRLEVSLGERVAVWHSGLSLSERYWTGRLVSEGRYRLVAGARSAIFAPLPNLGLIIVDEEHSDSYKQSDPAPRYHARDLATVRAQIGNAVCLLGSATPSCESIHNAQSGKYKLLRLKKRVQGRPLPTVRIVDLRQHRPDISVASRRGSWAGDTWITPNLHDALATTVQGGQKAIVFLNRRGHSTLVACKHCGHTELCADCGLALTYHSSDRTSRCHVCGRSEKAVDACPSCRGTDFLLRGAGTQKIEESLSQLDPAVRLARLDSDIAAKGGAAAEVLDGFAGDRYNILVGTQMVTKGLDVADVATVGVIWADQQMAYPDFRAEERTFQLLTQVAGRAGRGGHPGVTGEVIVQTFHPDHQLIELAAAQDAESFYERELPRRQLLSYPPFARLVLLIFSSESEAAPMDLACDFASWWRRGPGAGKKSIGHLLGPAPAVIPRRAKRHFVNALIKTTHIRRTTDSLKSWLDTATTSMRRRKVTLAIDVDPVDFM